MKEAFFLFFMIGLALSKPGGYYHQEYNYKSSSSSFKNNELQHKNEDEGFYSKDGDLEGRLKPKVNSHSQHSEYLNPKIHSGYQANNGYGSSGGISQASSDRLFSSNSNGYQSGGVDGYASSERVIDLSNIYPSGGHSSLQNNYANYGSNQGGYDSSYRRVGSNEGRISSPMGVPSNYGYSQGHNSYGSVQRENSYGGSIQRENSYGGSLQRDNSYGSAGNYGTNTYLNSMAQRLQSDMSKQLENAIYNQYKTSSGYSSSISNTQMSADIRALEDELRRNLTRQLDESLRSQQNQHVTNTYPTTNSVNYNHQELADVSRQLENDLMKKLHEDIRTTYNRQSSSSYSSSNNEIYHSGYHTASTTYRPYTERHTVVIPSNIRYTPIPNPESLTQIASRIQSDINTQLDSALSRIYTTYLSGSSSYYTIEDFNREVDRIKEDIIRNSTSNMDDQIRKNYGHQVLKDNYYYSVSGNGDMSSQYNYNIKDYDDLRRQVEENLLKKLNQTVATYREEYQRQSSYNMNSNTYSVTQRPAYYTSENKVYDYSDLQRQLSQQVQNALNKHRYESAYSTSSSYTPQAYQTSLDELSRELQRNLTDQLNSYRAHSSSSMSSSYGYGSGSAGSGGSADFESMKKQLQNQLMQQLQQGLQQQHRYSASASYSASSSASDNKQYGSHQSYGNYDSFVECCSPIEGLSSYSHGRSKRDIPYSTYSPSANFRSNVKSVRRTYSAKNHFESESNEELSPNAQLRQSYKRNFQTQHFRNERHTDSDSNENYQRIETSHNSRETSETNQQIIESSHEQSNKKLKLKNQKLIQSQDKDDFTQELETSQPKRKLVLQKSFGDLELSGSIPHQELVDQVPNYDLKYDRNSYSQQQTNVQLDQHLEEQGQELEDQDGHLSLEKSHKYHQTSTYEQQNTNQQLDQLLQKQQLAGQEFEDQDAQLSIDQPNKLLQTDTYDQQPTNHPAEQLLQEKQKYENQDILSESRDLNKHHRTNTQTRDQRFDQELQGQQLDQEILHQKLELEDPIPTKHSYILQQHKFIQGPEQKLQGQQFEEQDNYLGSDNMHKTIKNKLRHSDEIIEDLEGGQLVLSSEKTIPAKLNPLNNVEQDLEQAQQKNLNEFPIDDQNDDLGQQLETSHGISSNKNHKISIEEQSQQFESNNYLKPKIPNQEQKDDNLNQKLELEEPKQNTGSSQKVEDQLDDDFTQQLQIVSKPKQKLSEINNQDQQNESLQNVEQKYDQDQVDLTQQLETIGEPKPKTTDEVILGNQYQTDDDIPQNSKSEITPETFNQKQADLTQQLETGNKNIEPKKPKLNFGDQYLQQESDGNQQLLAENDGTPQVRYKPKKHNSHGKLEISHHFQDQLSDVDTQQTLLDSERTFSTQDLENQVNAERKQTDEFGSTQQRQIIKNSTPLSKLESFGQNKLTDQALEGNALDVSNMQQIEDEEINLQKQAEINTKLENDNVRLNSLHNETPNQKLQPDIQNPVVQHIIRGESPEEVSSGQQVLTHTQITRIEQHPTQTFEVIGNTPATSQEIDRRPFTNSHSSGSYSTSNVEGSYQDAIRQQDALINLLKQKVESQRRTQGVTSNSNGLTGSITENRKVLESSNSLSSRIPPSENTDWTAGKSTYSMAHHLNGGSVHVQDAFSGTSGNSLGDNHNIQIHKLSPGLSESISSNPLSESSRYPNLPLTNIYTSPVYTGKSTYRIRHWVNGVPVDARETTRITGSNGKISEFSHNLPSDDLSYSYPHQTPANFGLGSSLGDSQITQKYTRTVTRMVNGQPISAQQTVRITKPNGEIVENSYKLPLDENYSRNPQATFSSSSTDSFANIPNIGSGYSHINGQTRRRINHYVNGKLVSSSDNIEPSNYQTNMQDVENIPSIASHPIGYNSVKSSSSSYSSRSSSYSGSQSY